jgi:hypothetical protein
MQVVYFPNFMRQLKLAYVVLRWYVCLLIGPTFEAIQAYEFSINTTNIEAVRTSEVWGTGAT